jgi:CRISPR-associated protein Csb1
MDFTQLLRCVNARSVIRLRVDLEPANPDGAVCPPTYAAGKRGEPPHISFRRAFVDGQPRDIVVLDSPQSQSNRVEQAILAAHRAGRMSYPDIEIAFPAASHEPVYSVLQLSHRVYDAVMRACTLDGKPFFETEIGRAILESRPSSATALFVHAPVTLVLGAWDSNGGGGPLSAKIPRLLTSEIIGLDASPAEVSATKFDPMDIRANVAELLLTTNPVRRFEIKGTAGKSSKEKGKRPSELGFGSVPPSSAARSKPACFPAPGFGTFPSPLRKVRSTEIETRPAAPYWPRWPSTGWWPRTSRATSCARAANCCPATPAGSN